MPGSASPQNVDSTKRVLVAFHVHDGEGKDTPTGSDLRLEEFKLTLQEKEALQTLHLKCFVNPLLSPSQPNEHELPQQKLTSEEEKVHSQDKALGTFLRKGRALAHEFRILLQRLDDLEILADNDKTATDKYKLLLNEYRSTLMKVFENHLQSSLKSAPPKPDKKPPPAWKNVLRYVSYGFLLVIGMVMDGIGSFLGGQELISLIPGISGPLGMTLGIVFSLINSALFYSFEAAMLKQMVGLDSLDEISKKLDMDQDQIQRSGKINELLLNPGSDQLDPQTYTAYAALAEQVHKTIAAKKHLQHQDLPEKTSRKIFRHAVTLVGALMVCGYGYFMVNSLLVFLAPAILGTPLGWTFIGIGIFTMLAYYLSMRGKAMVNMLNPASKKFKEVKQQYLQFEEKPKPEFKKTYDAKAKVFRLEKTCEEQQRELAAVKQTALKQQQEIERLKNPMRVFEAIAEPRKNSSSPQSTSLSAEERSLTNRKILGDSVRRLSLPALSFTSPSPTTSSRPQTTLATPTPPPPSMPEGSMHKLPG